MLGRLVLLACTRRLQILGTGGAAVIAADNWSESPVGDDVPHNVAMHDNPVRLSLPAVLRLRVSLQVCTAIASESGSSPAG